MKPTQQLHDLGQSLWLDNITRGLLTSGTLRHYIDDFSITGLTSNPSIFDLAIKNSNFYDDAIHQKGKEGKSGEALFFELAIEDLRQAADLFRPVYDATARHGWLGVFGGIPVAGVRCSQHGQRGCSTPRSSATV